MRFFRISRRPYFWRVRALACCGFVFAFISGAARAQQAQPDTYTGFDGQKISAVEIAAGPDVDTVALRSLVQLQSGQPFSDAAMRQGVAALQQTHRFKQVQVSLQPDAQGLRVLFILQPALYVGILRFPGTGRPFSYPALLQAANIPEQSPYFADLLTTGRRGLLDYFQKQGYFEAEVEPEIETDAPHRIVNVIFRCTMRQRARVRDIDFTGLSPEQIVSTRTALRGLWARLKKVSLKPGEKYSEPHIAKSIDFIRDHLRDEGQLAPSVKLTSKNYDPSTHQVDITFGVVPGPKVFVKVAGAHVSNKTIRKLVPIYEE